MICCNKNCTEEAWLTDQRPFKGFCSMDCKSQYIRANSGKTAISRNRLSAPARFLKNTGLLKGRLLDYGCGKGYDTKELGATGYDPNNPEYSKLPMLEYDTIMCNYVLNVVDKPMELGILDRLAYNLKENGIAYITVRRDVKQDGLTKRGTYQRNVVLPFETVTKGNGYEMYKATMADIWKYTDGGCNE